MRTPHSACRKGKRVKVVLRDGTALIDHFEDRTDRWIVLRKHGRVMKSDLRAFIVLKAETERRKTP